MIIMLFVKRGGGGGVKIAETDALPYFINSHTF